VLFFGVSKEGGGVVGARSLIVMPRVRVIHWKAVEAGELLKRLKDAGYQIESNERALPDAVVIDLSRLPSHGREVAIALRGAKKTRQIPIVFVDGSPEKVEAIRQKLPDAAYTSRGRLAAVLKKAIQNAPADPVVPAQMMDRYASKPACAKLGIGPGARVAVIDPPSSYTAVIGMVPEGVVFEENGECPVTLWFVQDLAAWRSALRRIRGVCAGSKLWILWRKGTEITLTRLREDSSAVGLVDYKICSVNQTWSGTLLALGGSKRGAGRTGT
jgi:CheY-like chemotaxis protein